MLGVGLEGREMASGPREDLRDAPFEARVARARLLLGVHVEVVDPRAHPDIRDSGLVEIAARVMGLHHLEMDFVFEPAHGHEVVLGIHEHRVAPGLAVIGQKERGLVDAVDVARVRDGVGGARDGQRGVEEVGQVEETVALTRGRDGAGPVGDAGHAHAALPGRALAAAPGVESVVGVEILVRAVVGGEEDEGVFELAGLLQHVDQTRGDVVDLDHGVLVRKAGGAAAGVALGGVAVILDARERMLKEERHHDGGGAADEVLREVGEFLVDLGELLDRGDLFGRFERAALHAPRDRRVGHLLKCREPFGAQHEVWIEAFVELLRDVAEDGGAGGRAGRLGIGRGQHETLAGETVDLGRGRADRDAAAIDAGIAPAHVVDQKDEDVRLASETFFERRELVGGGRLLFGARDVGLQIRRVLDRRVEDVLRGEGCGAKRGEQRRSEQFPAIHEGDFFLNGVQRVRSSGSGRTVVSVESRHGSKLPSVNGSHRPKFPSGRMWSASTPVLSWRAGRATLRVQPMGRTEWLDHTRAWMSSSDLTANAASTRGAA